MNPLDELHRLIDEWAAKHLSTGTAPAEPEAPARVLPEGKRAIRTKSTGDRVYVVDDVAKTKAWVTSPEVLNKLGFEMGDVVEIEDKDLLGYVMAASLYKVK